MSQDVQSLEDLWTRWVAGQTLDEADRAALMAGVEQNDVFRRRVVHDWQMENALRAAGAAEHDRELVVARVKDVVLKVRSAVGEASRARAAALQPRRWSHTRAVIAAAAVAGAAALMLLLPLARQRPHTAVVKSRGAVLTKLDGRVTVHRAAGSVPGKVGLALGAGESLSTGGSSSHATLTYGDGPRIELGSDSALTVLARGQGDPKVLLFHGKLAAAGAGLHLGTPHATVFGRGRVALGVSPRLTSVEVQEGTARVVESESGRESRLGAGQSAMVRPESSAGRVVAELKVLLLVASGEGPDETLIESDRLFKERLEMLGYALTMLDARDVTEDVLRQADVVVLSFTIDSGRLPVAFSDLSTPLVAVESSAFQHLHFTGPRWMRDVGTGPRLTDIEITNPSHPLAAGLAGTVRVMAHAERVRWAAPPPSASEIASYRGAPQDKTLVFAYDRGDMTPDGPAASRRVGLFLGNDNIVRSLNEQGWRLFDAAVAWCASAKR